MMEEHQSRNDADEDNNGDGDEWCEALVEGLWSLCVTHPASLPASPLQSLAGC